MEHIEEDRLIADNLGKALDRVMLYQQQFERLFDNAVRHEALFPADDLNEALVWLALRRAMFSRYKDTLIQNANKIDMLMKGNGK